MTALLMAPWAPAPARAVEMTDIALVLAVDVSESVTPERYALQMEGIARAFHDREVQASILSGAHHSMYVTLVEWSNRPFSVLPWTLITSAEDADAFAEKVRTAPRADNQFTCLSRALETIEGKVLPFLPVPAERTVLDVSGDGRENCNPAKSVTFCFRNSSRVRKLCGMRPVICVFSSPSVIDTLIVRSKGSSALCTRTRMSIPAFIT